LFAFSHALHRHATNLLGNLVTECASIVLHAAMLAESLRKVYSILATG
jgi:hypothetical protein